MAIFGDKESALPQRILLGTVGMTPQVITETLHELVQPPRFWRPDRIEIVTTGKGLATLRRLWPKMRRALAALFPDRTPPLTFHAPRADGDGVARLEWAGVGSDPDWDGLPPLRADILTPADVESVGDLIKDCVWTHVKNPECELHLSIAGGRKTMSAHALLALALLGRPQDEASHVLVEPPFEDNEDFWHRAQGWRINTAEELRAARFAGADLPEPSLDPASATLTLIGAPTPVMAETPSDRETLGNLRFAEILEQVERARRFLAQPSLVFDDSRRVVTISGVEGQLKGKTYVLLRLLARATRERWTADGWLTLDAMIGSRSAAPGPCERAIHYIANEPGMLPDASKESIRAILDSYGRYRRGETRTGREIRDGLSKWLKSIQMTEMCDEVAEVFGPLVARALLRHVDDGPTAARRIALGCGHNAISGTV